MKIAMNSTATLHCNVVQEIKIAREIGFQGVEIQIDKLFRYLDAGNRIEQLRPLLGDMEVAAIGALQNIERQGDAHASYIEDVRKACETASGIGASMVQICTGPSDLSVVRDFHAGVLKDTDTRYRGLLGETEDALIEQTANNVAEAADIAADYGLELYIEPLAWVPLCKISQALKVIEAAGKKNVGVVIDFWHMWTTGETPEFVASIPKELIKMVHICDGIRCEPGAIPDQDVLRDVWTGEGDIPLKRWIDAVKQTGYDGWCSTEIFSNRIAEKDPVVTAATLKTNFEYML